MSNLSSIAELPISVESIKAKSYCYCCCAGGTADGGGAPPPCLFKSNI
jgi:hypothetical protein